MIHRRVPELLGIAVKEGLLAPKTAEIMQDFYMSYIEAAMKGGAKKESLENLLFRFAEIFMEELRNPFAFPPYHEHVRTPHDYYMLGLDFIRPLVDWKNSLLLGKEHVVTITEQLAKGHNVILLANHQTEPDPQAISLMLEHDFPKLAREMIFVAGERVITDPLAIPFSKGRNLLCIYSKRYIDFPPEEKQKKQLHNTRTMELMSTLLSQGGKCIYVAPSGGRDRKNAAGELEVAPFDPQSVEMLYLMSQRAKQPTHFYPLALFTYDILPPPEDIQRELGERRICSFAPIRIAFCPEFDMQNFPGKEEPDKRKRREVRTRAIFDVVVAAYQQLQQKTRV